MSQALVLFNPSPYPHHHHRLELQSRTETRGPPLTMNLIHNKLRPALSLVTHMT